MIDFKKPISCQLFPVGIKEYRDFEMARNDEKLKVCQPERESVVGKIKNTIVCFSERASDKKNMESLA